MISHPTHIVIPPSSLIFGATFKHIHPTVLYFPLFLCPSFFRILSLPSLLCRLYLSHPTDNLFIFHETLVTEANCFVTVYVTYSRTLPYRVDQFSLRNFTRCTRSKPTVPAVAFFGSTVSATIYPICSLPLHKSQNGVASSLLFFTLQTTSVVTVSYPLFPVRLTYPLPYTLLASIGVPITIYPPDYRNPLLIYGLHKTITLIVVPPPQPPSTVTDDVFKTPLSLENSQKFHKNSIFQPDRDLWTFFCSIVIYSLVSSIF